jgi:thiamine transport system substrate-binding protein
MKNRTLLIITAVAGLLAFSAGQAAAGGAQEEADLVIYTYDSFVAEWGPGPRVIPMFEEKTGHSVTIISAGDAGQMVSRAILEKNNPKADILLGIDNNLLSKALESGILEPYKAEGMKNVPKDLHFDPTYHVLPYDYGYFSIIYDSETVADPPASLEDLTKQEFADSLILMDPRTSSPGLGFLLWTVAVYGENFTDYWERLKPSILTITEGWDTGYGLFTSGEAPLVLSYTTSPAYHLEYENTRRYRSSIFEKGNYMQIEGAGITAGSRHRKAAEAFIDFMLTEDFQSVIPLTNWMFPVLPDIGLPDSFEAAKKPETGLTHSYADIARNYERWIEQWTKHLSR